MSWARRRQALYGLLVGGFLFSIIASLGYSYFSKPPTCTDGKQNGAERGVDCGGACALLCRDEVRPLNIVWSRSFKVAEGLYNAIAYIENPNVDAIAEVPYLLALYDTENVLIDDRAGVAQVTAAGPVPVFEAGIRTGARAPGRTFFSITGPITWKRISALPKVSLSEEQISYPPAGPRIDATIHNDEVYEIFDIEISALVYDETGNAMGVSRTVVSRLGVREEKQIFFTWPIGFPEDVGRIELIPRIPPQKGR